MARKEGKKEAKKSLLASEQTAVTPPAGPATQPLLDKISKKEKKKKVSE